MKPILACEPILPLGQLMAGSLGVGPLMLTQSVFWLAVAVIFKSVAFALLNRRFSLWRGGLYMLVANILSTIPGFFTAASASFSLIALPVVYLMGKMTEKRFPLLFPQWKSEWIGGCSAMLLFMGFFLFSTVSFYAAEDNLSKRNYEMFWLLKYLFVTMAAAGGMAVSAVLEEFAVAWLARKQFPAASFYPAVFRANYLTLALVLIVCAWTILPKRLHDPHFISVWLKQFSHAMGMG